MKIYYFVFRVCNLIGKVEARNIEGTAAHLNDATRSSVLPRLLSCVTVDPFISIGVYDDTISAGPL